MNVVRLVAVLVVAAVTVKWALQQRWTPSGELESLQIQIESCAASR